MGNRIAELSEIGRKLNEARVRSGQTVPELLAKMKTGICLTTWYRIINGEGEGGCRTVAEASLLCGTRPDAILLETTDTVHLAVEDRVCLDQIYRWIAEITACREDWPERRPAAILADHVRSIYEAVKAEGEVEASGRIPMGTTISRPEPGFKVLEPPPAKAKGKRAKRKVAKSKRAVA
jgi:hypothetical protein